MSYSLKGEAEGGTEAPAARASASGGGAPRAMNKEDTFMSKQLCSATLIAFSFIAATLSPGSAVQAQKKPIEVLFLGHTSTHHDSGKYAPMLKDALAPDGINISYTTELADLNAA